VRSVYSRAITDQGIITALGHPLRARILSLLDAGEASPKELAASLTEKLGNVSYHVRILARLGLIELVRETPRRGAVEHHYRSVPRPEAVANLELSLSPAGWDAAASALTSFTAELEKIVRRHGGGQQGRVVAALLGSNGD
jgi:DNA-binding transcriptional ArsR family regulator